VVAKFYNFKDIYNKLLEYTKFLNRIPSSSEINNNEELCHKDTLLKLFKDNGYGDYKDHLESLGFVRKKGGESKYNIYSFEEACNLFIELSNKIGRPLIYREMIGKYKIHPNLPDARWFVKNCLDKTVTGYDLFLIYLGYKPRYNITKEKATEMILNKQKQLGRKLYKKDFDNIGRNNNDNISVSTIYNIWGNFNSMLNDLGMEINQENMQERHKTLEELEHDIKELCNFIYKTKGIKNISIDDINNCEWCLNYQAYSRYFRRYLDMTLGEYIKSIGFIPNESGMGMIYEFEDGEVTTSQWEYICTKFFKDNSFKYKRNVKYKSFINNYKGNKDCDYVFNINNKIWYIEIAGILDYTKQKKDTKVRIKYKKDLKNKEQLLKDNNLNYKIIYPHQLKSLPLEEVFSFLFK